jgi:two-component system, NtrC family, sensor kinase
MPDMGVMQEFPNLCNELKKVFAGQYSLFTALREGLLFICKEYGFTHSLLVVQEDRDKKPLACIHYPEEKDWQNPERQKILQALIHSRGQKTGTSNPEGRMFPLPGNIGQLGYLYIEKQPGMKNDKLEWTDINEVVREFSNLIQRARYAEVSSDSIDDRNKLSSVYADLDTKTSLDEIQLHLVNEIREVINCEAASIVFFESNHAEDIQKRSLISGQGWIYQVELRVGEGLAGSCIKEGICILTNQPEQEPGYIERIDMVPGLEPRSLIYVPILDSENIVGLLQVINKATGAFEEADLYTLRSLVKSIVKPMILLQTIHQLKATNAHLETSRWELIRSRNTLRSLIDNLPDSLYIINGTYRIVAINSARSERVKAAPRALVGNVCFEVLFNRDTPCPDCQVPKTFLYDRVTNRTEREWQGSGEIFEWEISTYPIFDENGAVIQAILVEKDVTERRRMEMIVAQSEKMAAVGQLAAGIAHEINNPLTVVLANAQILIKELPGTADWRELAELINKAGTRALHTVRNLLDFARQEKLDFEKTDVNDTLERALEMLQHQFSDRSVQLVYLPDTELQLITANAGNLQSVWVNLIMNALDSVCPGEGQVTVRTVQHEQEMRILISDNGHGISAEAMNRIFEPFYTTKDPGKGTGLGLSICHRIIKQHGGHIEVDSQTGQGTMFTIRLPVF